MAQREEIIRKTVYVSDIDQQVNDNKCSYLEVRYVTGPHLPTCPV